VPDVEVPYADLPIYQDELALALGFDAAELEMNRAGRLGPAEARLQMRRMVKAIGGSTVFSAAAVGFGFLLRSVGVASVSGVELLVAIAPESVISARARSGMTGLPDAASAGFGGFRSPSIPASAGTSGFAAPSAAVVAQAGRYSNHLDQLEKPLL
jgi:hypothetical protein